jgi:hypothetical protein
MKPCVAMISTLLLAGVVCAADVPPRFVKKPTAVRAGDKTKIDFSVDRDTDVAITVEDAKGKIIRHLVAGVLGKNPPQPLEANTRAQSLSWDGKDDFGKVARGGPFRVRVQSSRRSTSSRTATGSIDSTTTPARSRTCST